MRAIELPGARIDCSGFNRAGQIIHGQSARCESSWIGLDPNCALNAVDVYLRNTRENRDALRYRSVGIFVEITIGESVRDQTKQINSLIVWICFGKRGRTWQIQRQLSGCALDRRLYVCRRVHDTFAKNKLKRELSVSLRAVTGDDVKSRNLQKLFLQWRGDVIRHRSGIRTGVRTSDLDYRVINRRQIVNSELVIGSNSSNDHRQG